MSKRMFIKGRSPLGALKYGVEGRVGDGLGFVGDKWFVDQHFLSRGRFARALRAMQDGGHHYNYGIGVDENTAVVFEGGKLDVVGYKGALVLDISKAKMDKVSGEFRMRGIKLTYLDSGDSMDVRTHEVRVSRAKWEGRKIDPRIKPFKPYYDDEEEATFPDMLSVDAVYMAMYHALDNAGGKAKGIAVDPWDDEKKNLGFEFQLRRCDDTDGWYSDKNGYSTYTIRNVQLDIVPVKLKKFPLYESVGP